MHFHKNQKSFALKWFPRLHHSYALFCIYIYWELVVLELRLKVLIFFCDLRCSRNYMLWNNYAICPWVNFCAYRIVFPEQPLQQETCIHTIFFILCCSFCLRVTTLFLLGIVNSACGAKKARSALRTERYSQRKEPMCRSI